MDTFLKSGRYLFAIALAGFGVEHFIFSHSRYLGDILPYTARGPASAWLFGAGLLAASVALLIPKAAPLAGRLLGIALAIDFLIVHVPRMLRALADAGLRTRGFETLSMAAIAFVLAATSARERAPSPDRPRTPTGPGLTGSLAESPAASLAWFGCILFAIALFIFGAQHFMLIPFIASLIPAWMPGRVFLAWFTGAGFIAAALSIATGKVARLAGVMLAAMFLIWVVTLHAPRVAHKIRNGDEWCSMLIPLALAGGGLAVAERAAPRRRVIPA